MKRTLAVFMVMVMLLLWLPRGAFAASEVTLSSGGSLNSALAEVEDGGTIHISGTVCVTSALSAHGKTVTITGGTLDLSSLTTVTLGDHITFDNITLTFASGATVYAAGYRVTIGAGVTLTEPVTIYGGKSGGTVASTDLTLLAGTYTNIYGGSRSGTVTGDTHLTVGGTVNADIDETNHSGENRIHGGNYGGNIGGRAYTVFTGSAKARYIYGGSRGSGTITGGTDVTVSGGRVMSVNGGGRSGDHNGDVKLLISGGTMEQVFGGANGASLTGDVALDITGGTITRRVYGGCYNEVTRSGLSFVWGSSHYVTGNIVVTLHSGANIDFTSSESDRSIYAHSRQKTLSGSEVSHLVYADATAYAAYKNKVKAQDFAMQLIMGSTGAADYIHYRTYTAAGAVITQSCICGGCSATATLSAADSAYTGKAIQTAEVTCSGTWYGAEPVVSYTNNVNVGTATASMTANGVTASTTFAITEAPAARPGDMNGDDAVNNDDVLYLLWNTLFGSQDYPIVGNTDVNNDNTTSNDDVLYLLWHTLFGAEEYPLN